MWVEVVVLRLSEYVRIVSKLGCGKNTKELIVGLPSDVELCFCVVHEIGNVMVAISFRLYEPESIAHRPFTCIIIITLLYCTGMCLANANTIS